MSGKITFSFKQQVSRFKKQYDPSFWVTVSANGKVSIEGLLRFNTSAAHRYEIKNQINKIIDDKDWNNPAVSGFNEVSAQNQHEIGGIVTILKNETKSLKSQYLEFTKDWAIKNFARSLQRSKWTHEDWCEYFGLTPVMQTYAGNISKLSFPKGFYNTKNASTYTRMNNEIGSILSMGMEKYLAKEAKAAEDHYNYSIEKLAERIKAKDLNMEKLVVKTSHIKVNIETVLTDGEKTVRAFTIVASGAIQRPHYRYLIK